MAASLKSLFSFISPFSSQQSPPKPEPPPSSSASSREPTPPSMAKLQSKQQPQSKKGARTKSRSRRQARRRHESPSPPPRTAPERENTPDEGNADDTDADSLIASTRPTGSKIRVTQRTPEPQIAHDPSSPVASVKVEAESPQLRLQKRKRTEADSESGVENDRARAVAPKKQKRNRTDRITIPSSLPGGGSASDAPSEGEEGEETREQRMRAEKAERKSLKKEEKRRRKEEKRQKKELKRQKKELKHQHARKTTGTATEAEDHQPPRHGSTMTDQDDDVSMDPPQEVPRSDTPDVGHAEDAVRKGAFTEHEKQVIDRIIREFQASKDLSNSEIRDLVQSPIRKGQSKKLWSTIQEDLPNRTRPAILRFCRRSYHNYSKRGAWTTEEDEELQTLYDLKGDRWAEIGRMMDRHPEDVRDRYRNYLKCGSQRKKDSWTEEEEERLKEVMDRSVEAMQRAFDEEHAKHPDRMLQVAEYKDVNFTSVSDLMNKTRSRLQCSMKWKQMQAKLAESASAPATPASQTANSAAHVFGTPSRSWRIRQGENNWRQMLPGDKVDILRDIRLAQARSAETINWTAISKHADNKRWSTSDRKVALKHLLKRVEPQDTFDDTLLALIDRLERKNTGRLNRSASDAPASQSRQKRESKSKSKLNSKPTPQPKKVATPSKSNLSSEFVRDSESPISMRSEHENGVEKSEVESDAEEEVEQEDGDEGEEEVPESDSDSRSESEEL